MSWHRFCVDESGIAPIGYAFIAVIALVALISAAGAVALSLAGAPTDVTSLTSRF